MLESHYRFLLWLVPAVEHFLRSRSFLLGDRIQATALDMLEPLVKAAYTKRQDKRQERHLSSANLGLAALSKRLGAG